MDSPLFDASRLNYLQPNHPLREMQLLVYLDENPESTQREIADKLNVNSSVVNSLINKLTDRDFLQKQKKDGRQFRYLVTSDGYTFLRSKKEKFYEDLRGISKSYEDVARSYFRELRSRGIEDVVFFEFDDQTIRHRKLAEEQNLNVLGCLRPGNVEVSSINTIKVSELPDLDPDRILIHSETTHSEEVKSILRKNNVSTEIEYISIPLTAEKSTDTQHRAQDVRRRATRYKDMGLSNRLTDEKNWAEVLLGHYQETNKSTSRFTFLPSESERSIEYSWDRLLGTVTNTARKLHDLNQPRIGILMNNRSESILLTIASLVAGIETVVMRPDDSPSRHETIADDTDLEHIFTPSDSNNFESSFSGNRTIHNAEDFLSKNEAASSNVSFLQQRSETIQPDETGLIIFSSGTTGPPKGIQLSQYNLLVNCKATAETLRITSDDTLFCVLPSYHVNGLCFTVLTSFYRSSSLLVREKFHISSYWSDIEDYDVTIGSLVPTLLRYLINQYNQQESFRTPPSLRYIVSAAAPLDPELVRKFTNRFEVQVLQGYGLTEGVNFSTLLPPNLDEESYDNWMIDRSHSTVGTPIPGNELDVVDSNGQSLPPGLEGEIVLKGHNVMKGYHDDPEGTLKSLEEGVLHTGDQGFYEEDQSDRQLYFVTGREKAMINRGGDKINPVYVDRLIENIDGVHQAVTIGFPNQWYGEEVGAVVKLRQEESLSEEQIQNKLRSQIPDYQVPKKIILSNDLFENHTVKKNRSRFTSLFDSFFNAQLDLDD